MFDPEIHHRRSIRLRGYDYAAAGYYFVTICVQHKAPLLGEIIAGEMLLNDAGRMVEHWWQKLPDRFPHVDLDECVVMPNHFHGIIILQPPEPVRADPRVCPGSKTDAGPEKAGLEKKGGHMGPPLPRVMQWFKTMTTNAYIHGVKQNNWSPFNGRLWQRNYYERIVRNDLELHNIRQYIQSNPQNWAIDSENRPTRI